MCAVTYSEKGVAWLDVEAVAFVLTLKSFLFSGYFKFEPILDCWAQNSLKFFRTSSWTPAK